MLRKHTASLCSYKYSIVNEQCQSDKNSFEIYAKWSGQNQDNWFLCFLILRNVFDLQFIWLYNIDLFWYAIKILIVGLSKTATAMHATPSNGNLQRRLLFMRIVVRKQIIKIQMNANNKIGCNSSPFECNHWNTNETIASLIRFDGLFRWISK